MSRLPTGGGVMALLDGEQVLVRRAADGTVHAVSGQPDVARAYEVRIQHGIVEVALGAI